VSPGTTPKPPVFVSLILALLLAGCARNPATGRPEIVLVSRAEEREIGREESRRVAETMGLVEDPALTAYVRSIGERLAEHAPGRDGAYAFEIVDTAEPNAFALPGGYVYVSRGLLALLNSEDELAGVLGHEIGHVAARHAARRVTRAAPLAIVTGLGSAVTGIVSPILGEVVGGLGGLAGALVLAPYSRGQEHEADRLGQELAATSGWDPAGIARALDTLEREEALHPGRSRPLSFFSTHPPLPRRVAEAERNASTLRRGKPPPLAGRATAFVRRLDGLLVGPNPGDGVVDGERFAHPDLDFAVRFPAGWKVDNGRHAVAALAPGGDALSVLEPVGNGDDPSTALSAFERTAGVDLSSRAEPFRIGNLPAVRTTAGARTRDGRVALELTWIAHAGRIYRFTGATTPERSAAFQAGFRETAASFRPLGSAERAAVRATRLRVIAARQGETLAQLLDRTAASGWDGRMTAIANGLETTAARLGDGQPIKVARVERYLSR
jgi:predicted Zn-dependent protease